jgi:hypothetical protein
LLLIFQKILDGQTIAAQRFDRFSIKKSVKIPVELLTAEAINVTI